jgi:branched-chain amino acid transport system ATP-binding protein
MDAILQARGVSKRFGAVTAADDLNVAIREGEVVGIIGANGAGKTTFVNLVTGYLRPDHGTITYLGRDIVGLAPRRITRLGISRSFQVPQIFPRLSVIDNLVVALNIARQRDHRVLRRAHEPAIVAAAVRALEAYALAAWRDQRAGTLPQGVRKLLDIAMATVSEPRLVLLDEPTSGISVDEKFTLMDTLMASLKATGATILYVEHDMELVERYAARVIAFYEGRIIADGPPARVLGDADVRQYVVGAQLHRGPPRQRPVHA